MAKMQMIERQRLLRRKEDGKLVRFVKEEDGKVCVEEDLPSWSEKGPTIQSVRVWHYCDLYDSVPENPAKEAFDEEANTK
jgi:hypothetical protein